MAPEVQQRRAQEQRREAKEDDTCGELKEVCKLFRLLVVIVVCVLVASRSEFVEAGRSSGLIYNRDGKFIYKPPKSSSAHIIVIDDRTHPRDNSTAGKSDEKNKTNSNGGSDASGNNNIATSSQIAADPMGQQQQPIQLIAAPNLLGPGANTFFATGTPIIDPMMRRLTNGSSASQFQVISLADLGRQFQVSAQSQQQPTELISIGQKPAASASSSQAQQPIRPTTFLALATGPNGTPTLMQLIPAPAHLAGALSAAQPSSSSLAANNPFGMASGLGGGGGTFQRSSLFGPSSSTSSVDYDLGPDVLELSPPTTRSGLSGFQLGRAARIDSEPALMYSSELPPMSNPIETWQLAGGGGGASASRATPTSGYHSSRGLRQRAKSHIDAAALLEPPMPSSFEEFQRDGVGETTSGDGNNVAHLYSSSDDAALERTSGRRAFRAVYSQAGGGSGGGGSSGANNRQPPHNINQIIESDPSDIANYERLFSHLSAGSAARPSRRNNRHQPNSLDTSFGSSRSLAGPSSSWPSFGAATNGNNNGTRQSHQRQRGTGKPLAPLPPPPPPSQLPPSRLAGVVRRLTSAGNSDSSHGSSNHKTGQQAGAFRASSIDAIENAPSSLQTGASGGDNGYSMSLSAGTPLRPATTGSLAGASETTHFASSDEDFELRSPQSAGQQYWRQFSDQFDIIQ